MAMTRMAGGSLPGWRVVDNDCQWPADPGCWGAGRRRAGFGWGGGAARYAWRAVGGMGPWVRWVGRSSCCWWVAHQSRTAASADRREPRRPVVLLLGWRRPAAM